MAKRKVGKASDEADVVEFDSERLEHVKKCESAVSDSRLMWEEAKAKHGLARAEHRLLVAKRNRIIAQTDDPKQVEDAQREVFNASARAAKAKALSDAAKDHYKGSEEALAKAMTERLPLFEESRA